MLALEISTVMKNTITTTTAKYPARIDKYSLRLLAGFLATPLIASAFMCNALFHQHHTVQILNLENWTAVPAKVIASSHSLNYLNSGKNGYRYSLNIEYIAAGRKISEAVSNDLSKEDLAQILPRYSPNTKLTAYQNKTNASIMTLSPRHEYFWSGAWFWTLAAAQLAIIISVICAAIHIATTAETLPATRQRLQRLKERLQMNSTKDVISLQQRIAHREKS